MKLKRSIMNLIIVFILLLIVSLLKIGEIVINKIDKEVFREDVVNKVDNNIISTTTTTTTTTSTTTTTKLITTKPNDINNIKYIDGIMIVNKSYPLPSDFVPKNTYRDILNYTNCSTCIDKEAYRSFEKMKSDALALGLNIWIQSGYRSYKYQELIYNNYVASDGKELADTYSARPGYSEHQTGLAIDLNSITSAFLDTDEGIWVNENAYKYGFIIRYPEGKENITGYNFEPWHLRYVGIELASKLYNDGDWITLEEHFNIDSNYKD